MEKNLIQKTVSLVSKNSPAILTGFGVVGLITTAVLAVKATPKAICLIQDRAWEKFKEETVDNKIDYHEWLDAEPQTYQYKAEMKKLGWKEVVGITWKAYIPAMAVGLVTITCVIFSNRISSKRNIALASLYTLTETAFKEYQNKIVETIGKNKELKVRDDISGDKIKENPVSKNEVIITGKGEVLCYDSLSGRYFKSDIEQIRKMINDLNRDLLSDDFVTLNEFYDAIGLMPIKLGDDIGWDVNKGMIDVSFSAQLSEDDTPCLVLNYTIEPKYYK